MIKSTKCPKGFIELHIAQANPIPTMVRVDMISQITKVADEEKIKYGKRTHFCPLGHNNGGFYITETYEEVQEMIRQALED